jgi:hypothetical protein
MDFSNYLANKIISATVRNTPYDTPDSVWVALYTTDPTKDDKGAEVREPSYNRQELSMSVPVNGESENSAQVDFAQATSNWGNITYIGIRDQAFDGNLLYYTELDNAKNILSGDQFRIDADRLTLKLT